MRFTLKRWLAAGAVAAAAVITPLSVSGVLPGITGSPALLAGAGTPASPDTVIYGEGKGAKSNFLEFVSGSTGATTTEAVTSGGGCSTPNIQGVPLLNLTGYDYPNGTYAPGTKPAAPNAIVGAYQGRSGVCSDPPDWAINNNTTDAEGLDFGIGPNTLVAGREFAGAVLNLVNDSGPSTGTVVTLVETLGGAPAGSQTCTIATGATISADTSLPTGGPCTGTVPTPFDDLEVQVTTQNASASVAGPTSTFTLASEICGGDSIQSTGPVPATLTLTGAKTQCKSYTNFSSGPNATGQNSLSCDGFSAGSVPFTVNVTWPAVPLCQPYADSNHPDANSAPIPAAQTLPVCAPHEFSFDGTTYYDQAYCQAGMPPGPGIVPQQELCTANKSYNNDIINPNGSATPIMTTGANPVAGTQITEVWVGDIDWVMK